jgi:hypothetical protein
MSRTARMNRGPTTSGFSVSQQRVLEILTRRGMTTTEIGRRTSISLSRAGLITRLDTYTGPVQQADVWRLTTLGRTVFDVLLLQKH